MIRKLPTVVIAALAWLGVSQAHAELILRQSTASQVVLIGPFVDATDGFTPETGLTIDASDVRLSKNGANIVGKNSGGCTHDELGMYACTFDATDSSAVGRLQIIVYESGARPVYQELAVAEEDIYDACCASGATVAAADGSDFTAIPWNASWDAEVQSEATDALNAYDPPTNAEMVARTLASASYATASSLSTLDGEIDTIDTVVDAIKVKTDQLTFGVTNTLNVNVEYMNAAQLCGTGDSGSAWTGCP